MSRPEKPINWILVDNLLEAGCLGTEIASHFDMHPDTFYRRVEEQYGMGFTAYSSQKKQRGESILRAAQYAKAIGKSKNGDNTLLIWLGKQRLNQKESQSEVSIDTGTMKQFNDIMTQINGLQQRNIADKSISNEQKSA